MRLNTLKRRSEFDRLRRGRKWVAKGFILQAAPRDEASGVIGPRFGFAVGSKALKEHKPGETAKRPGAVLRNRARRRLKEAVRLLATDHARADYDYVVIGRRESLHQCFADLLEELQLAFGKVNRQPRANNGDTATHTRRETLLKETRTQTEKL